MVQVGNVDEDWLNGRQEMPHERRASFGQTTQAPATLSQVSYLLTDLASHTL